MLRPKRKITKVAIVEDSSDENDCSDADFEIEKKPAARKRALKEDNKDVVPAKRSAKSTDSSKAAAEKKAIASKLEVVKKSTIKRDRPVSKDTKTSTASNRTKLHVDDAKKTKDNIDGNCVSSLKTDLPKSSFSFNLFNNSRWTEPQLLSELQDIDQQTSRNIIRLFQEDNTIPFICRYRKELIGDMTPDKLRDIKISYSHILNIKSKQETIIKNLEKEQTLTEDIRQNLLSAKSLDELDHLYAPYKPASKASLAERAKALGLQEPAEQLLAGAPHQLHLMNLVDRSSEGLDSVEKVKEGIRQIIAHHISKDTMILEEIRKLQKYHNILLQSKFNQQSKKSELKNPKSEENSHHHNRPLEPSKFENYFDFQNNIRFMKPHQTLAINRGEHFKILSVKIVIPDRLKEDLLKFARKEYLKNGIFYGDRTQLFTESFELAYTKKLSPLIGRQLRSELTKVAEKASIEVFATNLKQLLLMSPCKGEKILGIDPGFAKGCKVALISECTDVLDTCVIYPNTQPSNSQLYGRQIAEMMKKHKCSLIALGNGTACRETEKWISDMLTDGVLDSKNVRYCIITEQGASIYSCGEIARKEFPKLDVNLISAVSIARRLNDPLGEFVKVDAKHLGVGMYQHDINEKLLTESLNEVVMECVSFVGVDINTASATLLQHVAGLTSVRAENIIKHRVEKGPFTSREQLKKVKQIGEKTFVQCAGFIRIEPLTAGVKHYNRLDSTWVHPESYDIAKMLMKKCNLNDSAIGSTEFISKMRKFETENLLNNLAKDFDRPAERIQSVLSALQREICRDYRSDFDKKPLFKQGLTKLSDLREGLHLTGSITNITHFGCFVDCGVEKDGLIHVNSMGGFRPGIGDRVNVQIINLDISRGRIGLKLQNIVTN